MARLFVAVWPPPAVVDSLARQLQRRPAPGIRWVPLESWHVTLRFLGRAEPDAAVAALDALVAPATTAVVGPQVTTLGRSVVCLPVAGLDRLAAAVRDVTAEVGEPPDERGFTGHLTVARRRGRSGVPTAAPVSARFEVGEVALVESRTLPSGAVYEVLHRWALPAGGAS